MDVYAFGTSSHERTIVHQLREPGGGFTLAGTPRMDLTFDDASALADTLAEHGCRVGGLRRQIVRWAGHAAFRGAAVLGSYTTERSWLDAWSVGGIHDWPLRGLAPTEAVPIVLVPVEIEITTLSRTRTGTKWLRAPRTHPHETGRMARNRLLSEGAVVAGRIRPEHLLPETPR